MRAPKLRFKDVNGNDYPDWEEKRLGEVCNSFEYGMNAAATKYDGKHKYLRITDIDDATHKYLSDDIVSPSGKLDKKYLAQENDIFFARTGASVGKTYIYNKDDGELYYAGFLIKANVKAEYDSYYIFLQTLTENYAKWVKLMSVRSGQPGINANEYASYKFFCTKDLEEQQKIASSFYTLDQIITDCQSEIDSWEQQKKGIIQQLFSQKIRFKEDDGSEYPEWNTIKADELFENIIDKGHPDEAVLTIVQGQGTISRSESGRNIQYDKEYLSAYKKVKKNDFIIHLRSFEGGLEIANEEGIVSPAYIVLRSKTQIAPLFYYTYFHTNEFINHNLSKTVEGIRDGRQISYQAFKNLTLPWCSYPEQQKIASYLSAFDDIISKSKQELETYQNLKKGLMQQMFV